MLGTDACPIYSVALKYQGIEVFTNLYRYRIVTPCTEGLSITWLHADVKFHKVAILKVFEAD